jgi:hypothetical protein
MLPTKRNDCQDRLDFVGASDTLSFSISEWPQSSITRSSGAPKAMVGRIPQLAHHASAERGSSSKSGLFAR